MPARSGWFGYWLVATAACLVVLFILGKIEIGGEGEGWVINR